MLLYSRNGGTANGQVARIRPPSALPRLHERCGRGVVKGRSIGGHISDDMHSEGLEEFGAQRGFAGCGENYPVLTTRR